jgi:hypothetical protein
MTAKEIFFPVLAFTLMLIPCAGASELPFIPKEFNVEIYHYPYMELINNFMTDNIETAYTFTDNDNNFELRYAFFTQTEINAENIQRSFALFIIPIIHRAAGFEVDLNEVELYAGQDVFEEYNGDIGVSVFIPYPPSDYGGGYAFMLISFFFKIEQGIVMQTILFDDIEFAGTDEFAEVSHSFRFIELSP